MDTTNMNIDGMSESADIDDIKLSEEGLTEIPVSEDVPIEDDESIAIDDGNEDDDLDEAAAEVIEMALCSFTQHTDSVYVAAINPQFPGMIITGGGDDVAYIWKYSCSGDLPNEGNIQTSIKLQGHKDTVASAGFNFDGTLALTGSYDGTVRVWDSQTGELKQLLEGPEDIEWAEWHNKGNAIIAGSSDGTIWMWMAHNGQCIQVFAGHDGGVSTGCFSKDGKTVCSGGEDGSVRLWAPKQGSCRHVFEGHFGHQAVVTCLVGSEDGDLLLSGSADGTVKLFQISGKKLLHTYQHSQPAAITATSVTAGSGTSATSGTATTGGGNKQMKKSRQLRGIKEHTNEDQLQVDDDDMNNDNTADMNQEEDQGNNNDNNNNNNNNNGDYDDNDDDEEEEGGGDELLSVECVDFSSNDYKWIASGGLDTTMKVWDAVSGLCRCVCRHPASVVSLKWHVRLPVVVTAALDSLIRIYDARAGTLLQELSGHTDMVTSITMRAVWSTGTPARPALDDCSQATDVIVSVSDDKTSRVYHVNMQALMK